MRHGEVQYFASTHPTVKSTHVELTDRGREQAKAAGVALSDIHFDRAITSGLSRTIETAKIVLQASSHSGVLPELERWKDLEEFRHPRLGEIDEGDVEAAFLTVFRGIPAREASYLYGETVGSLVDRVNAEIDRLLADPNWDTVLLVLHGGVNRAILSRALVGEPAFFGHLEQSPGCINVLDYGPSWFVRSVNVTPPNLAHAGARVTTIEEVAAQYRAFRGFAGVSPPK